MRYPILLYAVRSLTLLLTVLWLCPGSECLHADNPHNYRPQVTKVQVGLQGTLKIGTWSPISFEFMGLPGQRYQPLIKTADSDGNPFIQKLPSVMVADDADVTTSQTVQGVFLTGRLGASIQVAMQPMETDVAPIWTTIPTANNPDITLVKQSTLVWLALGEQPAFVAAAERWNSILPNSVQMLTLADLSTLDSPLPIDETGLDGVDLVIMGAETPVSEPISNALEHWTSRGGRLVVSFPGQASFAASPLAEWFPLQPTGEGDVRNLSGLNAAVAGSSPLRLLGSVKAAQFDRTQGVVLATGLSGPLLMRAAYGIGQVTVLGVDLNQRPLSNWENASLTDFAAVLANLSPPWQNQTLVKFYQENENNLSPTGVSDLQTQLVNILDAFPNVPRASHWGVLGWLALFILVIGPLDYFVLHHFLKKPRLTWITLPVVTLLASFLAISHANTVNDQLITARQVNLLDVDPAVNTLRGQSWMNFYSPQTARYEVAATIPDHLADASSPHSLRTKWTARPESTFRGMYRGGEIDPERPVYSVNVDQQSIPNLPVSQRGSGSISVEWEVNKENLVTADLTVEGSELAGTFSHNLPGDVNNWFVAFGSLAFYPRTREGDLQKPLAPGEVVKIDDLGSNLLKGVLIGLRQSTIYRKKGDRTDPNVSRDEYDIYNLDPFSNMRMISFHDAAGGISYTNLDNQTHRKLDLSRLIRTHRAVLFGRLEQPSTEFSINGEIPDSKLNETYVRIILPVNKVLRDNDAAPDSEFLKIK